jgi:dTDP-glucose pyrophosphorylase
MSNSWKQAIINKDSTICDALECINKIHIRIALVTSGGGELLGVVTDGDIRRGLLNGLTLTDSVDRVMNDKPLVMPYTSTTSDLVRVMKDNKVLSLPLIENGKLVGIKTLDPTTNKPKLSNPVVLMAGGFGTRLSPLTDNCPKPMLKIGGVPILEIVLQSFIRAGFSDFYISTHFMPEKIEDYFKDGERWEVNISYIYEETPLGTGGALGLLNKNLPDLPIIVMNCDVLTDVDFCQLLEFHLENCADVTMCVRKYDYQIPYGVVNVVDTKVESMIEKPVHEFFVNAGIYVVNPDFISTIPENEKLDMPTIIEGKMALNKNVLVFPIHEYWLDIGRMDDFNRAQIDIHNLHMLND